MRPHRCPICNGTGRVPFGFYGFSSGSSVWVYDQMCKTCDGTGIVWEPDSASRRQLDYKVPKETGPVYTIQNGDPPYWIMGSWIPDLDRETSTSCGLELWFSKRKC